MKSIFNHRQAHYTSYVHHCEDFSRIFINAKDILSDIISGISIYILYIDIAKARIHSYASK